MWKKIKNLSFIIVAEELLRAWVVQIAVPAGIGIMGWAQQVPWFYLSIGVVLAFACVSTWAVRMEEWRNINRVEHKLTVFGMRIHLSTDDARVAAIRFGFNLINRASFPVQYKIEQMDTSLIELKNNTELFPPKQKYTKTEFTVTPNSAGFFFDHDIAVPNNFEGTAIGRIEGRILYGKRGRIDNVLEIKKKTYFQFVNNTISGGQDWYDD